MSGAGASGRGTGGGKFESETPGGKKAKCEGNGGPPPLFDVMALLEFDA